MECSGCGARMREDARICLSCGEMVRKRVAPAERMQAAPAGVPAWIAFERSAQPGTIFYPAGRLQRIVAAVIDGIILSVIGYAFALALGDAVVVNEQREISVHWARLVPLIAINALYFIIFPATSWQGTPGKKLLGMRIVTLEEQPISILQSVARWFCQQVCFLVVFPLAAMVALFGIIAVPVAFLILMGGGRGPWDWMAGTKVVD